MSIEKSIVDELRGFAADLDDRDEVTPNELDMLRCAASMIEKLLRERDEARREKGCIMNEIDCRIEHGTDSNGHLEAIRSLFKENTND